ncbi:hypothetical protein AB205_0050750 [Aquarana catesbeiana]|uniref:Uncharacterized protein n=1 Tax=Aquarana catesbeiana TaxID=8400 RepID=A0A2G9Q8D4_AQUCT|nr:hypothetical protein AB205_0050750 [Aquarana catesbeiana]
MSAVGITVFTNSNKFSSLFGSYNQGGLSAKTGQLPEHINEDWHKVLIFQDIHFHCKTQHKTNPNASI